VDPAVIRRVSAIPIYNVRLHNTCVVTVIDGGQSPSALPEKASAIVNCRILAGDKQAQVQEVATSFWPGIPVIPVVSTATTDGRLMRHADMAWNMVIGLSAPSGGNSIAGLERQDQ